MVATWLDLSPMGISCRLHKAGKGDVPRTTPPFQTTNPTKDAKSKMYGQSRVKIRNGWNKVAIAMLIAQSTKSASSQLQVP
jgi:hypothetical protein